MLLIRLLSSFAGSTTICCWGTLLLAGQVLAAEPPPSSQVSIDLKPAKQLDKVINAVWQVTDLILDQHVNPPARQEMLLRGILFVENSSRTEGVPGLARLISSADGEKLRQILRDRLRPAAARLSSQQLTAMLMRGMVGALQGGAQYVPSSGYRVQKQLAENQYVGLGVQLAARGGVATFQRVFPRSPAKKAGIKDGDLVVGVNGTSTMGKSLNEVVQMLRGLRGSAVRVTVRQPTASQSREYKIVRDVVPIDTVVGAKRIDDEEWDYRLPQDKRIAYVAFENVNGSTTAEWRQTARRLRQQGFKAVILDFRRTRQANFHQTVLLADSLLDNLPIGKVRTVTGIREYRARAGATLASLPIAILVADDTSSHLHWLAEAVVRQGDVKRFGTPLRGVALRRETIELPSNLGAIAGLPTGVLQTEAKNPLPPSGVVQQREYQLLKAAESKKAKSPALIEKVVQHLRRRLESRSQKKKKSAAKS